SVIMLGILASGFSTMEGILLSLSSIFANDFYKNVIPFGKLTEEERKKKLLRVSKTFLVILAPVTFGLAYQQIVDPSLSVAIFAQNGVYAVVAATFVPILFGIFSKRATGNVVFIASVIALLVHFGMYYGKITMYYNNPAVPATCALLTSTVVALVGVKVAPKKEQK
ncbi:MAG: hypothetical protein NTV54_01215, partial [Ignavibacteriales bacterium]|nr:hypothetical protein [Ignavibacteriales bacterium]